MVYEVDFETLLIDAADRVLARKILNTWCDTFRDGWLGRHIPALALDQGLGDIQVAPYTMVLSPALAHLLMGVATVERAAANAVVTAAEGQALAGASRRAGAQRPIFQQPDRFPGGRSTRPGRFRHCT